MTRLHFVALVLLVGCGTNAAATSESSLAQGGAAEGAPPDGSEEQKLLHGQPSTGFLPKEVDIATVRAKFGTNALSTGVLVWDAKSGSAPPNWRTTDAVDASLASNGINTKGLDALHRCGSGMYDKHQFETVRQLARTLHKPLVVLALRQEPTGFIGDQPYSMYGFAEKTVNDWSNAGLKDADANARNDAIVDAIARAKSVVLYRKSALKAAIPMGQLPPRRIGNSHRRDVGARLRRKRRGQIRAGHDHRSWRSDLRCG